MTSTESVSMSELSGQGEFAVNVELNVPMTARDGTVLKSNVYRPAGEGPFPVLLTRQPYSKDLISHQSVLDPLAAAARGYIVVVQDVRGTFTSGGDFRPFEDEVFDGVDTVAWAASLPGASGRVGMYGLSYFGFTQLAAAVGGASELGAVAPMQRCADALRGFYFRQGAFELSMQGIWYLGAVGVAEAMRVSDPAALGRVLPALINEIDSLGSAGFASRPLAEFAPVRSHPVNQGFFTPLNHPMDPETLSFMNLPVEDSDVPSLNIGGWYDIFLQQTIDDFSAAKARNVPASLLIGPWAHAATGNPVGDVNFGVMSSADVLDLNGGLFETQLSWFDQWLKGAATNEEAPVKVFIMGSNRWATMDSWPPPEAREVEWYLGSDGRLSTEAVPSTGSDDYTYDPSDPVPTLGGALMADAGHRPGPIDQRPIEARADVLTFTSEPLEEDTEVMGRITAYLWAATSAKDTDFVVRLCDVHPDGRSINLTDGVVRARYRGMEDGKGTPAPVTPGEPVEYRIDLWSTANRFAAGHRIRVQVTSSNFPRWDANPNVEGDPFKAKDYNVAEQTILHGGDTPSCIVLPTMPVT
ncbi:MULTISPECIES: CocE/NonD family hydrolase [Micrococcales]|uniref:CocE/NonD family hydrolase n=1 Tax=Micrococcales TaxID=85006 RepID=UPI0009ED417D|nr:MULTISPECIES: CocE/NonD family hydrolase [Micrococcales]